MAAAERAGVGSSPGVWRGRGGASTPGFPRGGAVRPRQSLTAGSVHHLTYGEAGDLEEGADLVDHGHHIVQIAHHHHCRGTSHQQS